MRMRVGGMDPSLSNVGMARAEIDLDTLAIDVKNIKLSVTERQTTKSVRQNSDDVRRIKEHLEAIKFLSDCTVVFVEVPVGSKSARAMCSYGASCGVVAACPRPVIQVQPTEVKLATVGTKTASKEEMIEWAGELYPNLDWHRLDRDFTKGGKVIKPKGSICGDMEHIADSIAAVHAGIQTEQFKQLMAMWRATAGSVAAQTPAFV